MIKMFPTNYKAYQVTFWIRRGTKRAAVASSFGITSDNPDVEAKAFAEYLQSLTKGDGIAFKSYLGRFIADASSDPGQEGASERAGVIVAANVDDPGIRHRIVVPWLKDTVDVSMPVVINALAGFPLARLQKVHDGTLPDTVHLVSKITNQTRSYLMTAPDSGTELGDTPGDEGADTILLGK